MNKLKTQLQDFLTFIINPQKIIRSENIKQNMIEVGVYYGIISFVIGALLGLFRSGLEEFGIIQSVELSKSVKEMFNNIPLMFFLVVIIAPIFEELFFRGFVGLLAEKSYFRWVYYLSAVLFGLVHVSNYELSESQNLLISIIILPQLFLGFMLGFVRIKYGFYYCVLLHAVYNACLVSIAAIGIISS